MSMTRAELARAMHDITVRLENDSAFHKALRRKIAERDSSARLRRLISDYCSRTEQNTVSAVDTYFGLGYAGYEYLLRYFLMAGNLKEPEPHGNERRGYPKFEFWLDVEQWPDQIRAGEPPVIYTHPNAPGTQYRKGADGYIEYRPAGGNWADCARMPNNKLDGGDYTPTADQNPQPQPEGTPMLTITTKTLINGVDITSKTNDELFDAIAQAEAEIVKLNAIENKPKKLLAKIDELRAGIAALVAHMDKE